MRKALPSIIFMVAVWYGGEGTTAAGLCAGNQTVIVPFFADQPLWGWRLYRFGPGPKPITRKKLTAELLARAISTADGN